MTIKETKDLETMTIKQQEEAMDRWIDRKIQIKEKTSSQGNERGQWAWGKDRTQRRGKDRTQRRDGARGRGWGLSFSNNISNNKYERSESSIRGHERGHSNSSYNKFQVQCYNCQNATILQNEGLPIIKLRRGVIM